MTKNKTMLSVLSTTAITGLMVAAVNSTVFAKATAIAVNSNDGKVYEYQYDALKTSATAQVIKGSSDPDAKLYNDFIQRKTSIKAFYDDVKKSHVDFDAISKEAANASAKGVSFSLNSFIEATTTPTTTITTIPVSVDGSGNLIVNGQVVTSNIDMTSIKCSNPIDTVSTLVTFKLTVSNPQNYTVTLKGKTALLDSSTGTFSVYIDGNVSVSDIKVSDFTVNEKSSLTKPTVKSVVVIDSETIRVSFSKVVDYTYASNIANYKLTDSQGVDITNHIKRIYSSSGESDTSNTDTYYIKMNKFNPNNANEDWRLTNSKYILAIKNIIDTEDVPNAMDDYTSYLNVNDTKAPVGTGIYANLRAISTGRDKVVVYFSEDMDAASLTNTDNYKCTNGEGDTISLPADATITVGGDNKSVIIEFPTIYHVKTTGKTSGGSSLDITSLIVSNVKDVAGNVLDTVSYSNNDKIDKPYAGTNVVNNSVKVYYDGDDLKLDITFTRALDTVNVSDFAFGGVQPSNATLNGSKLTLIFKDGAPATAAEIAAHPIAYVNGKNNSNPTKIDIIKSQGQNAKLAINATTTTDETGARVSINADGSPATLSTAQSTVYDYQADPKTASNYWSAIKAANGGEVFLTFDTPLDPNSGIKTDDFTFTGSNGTDILADSVTVSGNTVVFKFNATNKNYAAFTSYVDVRAKSSVSLRTLKDVDGNNACYVPSNDDIKKRTITISQ
ncbi:cell surface protein [Clostridium sp. PL3]|uniref:Cell surface protein n=1 Tax=Clostridium thailandense TaxID=2794346 RepID=A0A949WS63_9CLOT|nr:cell surface protein [Clostridium thailandense]MBV7274746.1 cell surface protein [Clostridium thailandense]